MTHATVTQIPKVEGSGGNWKITVSPLVNGVNFHLTISKTFGYYILQIAYSSAVMWNRIEKHAGFAWLKMKCQICSVYCRTVVVISVCGHLWHVSRHGPTKKSSITQALATCEPHITTSCAGLWPPLFLNCSENKRSRRVQSGVCFVCSHGGLPLDAFIIFLSDATVPRGGDVTARSMSNMKGREATAKDLWGETNLTRSVLRWEARRHHVACTPARLHIRPACSQPTIALKVWGGR